MPVELWMKAEVTLHPHHFLCPLWQLPQSQNNFCNLVCWIHYLLLDLLAKLCGKTILENRSCCISSPLRVANPASPSLPHAASGKSWGLHSLLAKTAVSPWAQVFMAQIVHWVGFSVPQGTCCSIWQDGEYKGGDGTRSRFSLSAKAWERPGLGSHYVEGETESQSNGAFVLELCQSREGVQVSWMSSLWPRHHPMLPLY